MDNIYDFQIIEEDLTVSNIWENLQEILKEAMKVLKKYTKEFALVSMFYASVLASTMPAQAQMNFSECRDEVELRVASHIVETVGDSIETRLDETFKKHCKCYEDAFPVYSMIVSKLTMLPIIDGFADFDNYEKTVHFNIMLKGGFRLTIDKPLATSDDNYVAYTLTLKGEPLFVDCMALDRLLDSISNLVG